MPDPQEAVDFEAPGFKLKAMGANLIPLLTLLGMVLMAVTLYFHTAEAATERQERHNSDNRVLASQQQIVNAMREANCLNRLTPKQKENPSEIKYCEQLGQGR